MSKIAALMAEAEKAYDAETRAWFEELPTEDLTALWGIACVSEVAWDDEVFDALDRRGWFEVDVKPADPHAHEPGAFCDHLLACGTPKVSV